MNRVQHRLVDEHVEHIHSQRSHDEFCCCFADSKTFFFGMKGNESATNITLQNDRPTAATSRCSVQVGGIRDTSISPTHGMEHPRPEEQRCGERLCARDGKQPRPSPPPSQKGRPRLVGWGLPCTGSSETLNELEGFWTPRATTMSRHRSPASSSACFCSLSALALMHTIPSTRAAPCLALSLLVTALRIVMSTASWAPW